MEVTPPPRLQHIIDEFDAYGYDTTIDPRSKRDGMRPFTFGERKQLYWLIRNMGGTSELYESRSVDVDESLKAEQEADYETIRNEVSEHLTIEELYENWNLR